MSPLLAWYKLDGNALDSSGNGLHGSASNVSWVDGKIAQAGSFDGSSSFISIQPMEVTSVSLWINFNLVTTVSYFLGYSLNRGIRYDGAEFLVVDGAFGYTLVPWTKVDAFVNFTVVIRGAECDIYIDGVKIGVANKVTPLPLLSVERIGNRRDGYCFPGHIDDVRFYDHALSEKEIKELAKAKILHYTFDDFQEPTENLLYDSGVINWTIGNLVGTFSRTTIETNVKYRITSGASSTSFRFYVPLTKLTNGKTYTLSYNYSIIQGTAFSMSDWCDTGLFNREDTAGYSSASGTRATYDSTYRFMDFSMSADSIVEIWNVQLEQKDHATPFVNGTRTGSVSDKSGYDNHAELELATTPQWTEDSKIGSGAYKFGKTQEINTNIKVNTANYSSPGNQATISAWVSFEELPIYDSLLIGGASYSGFGIAVGVSGIRGYYRNNYTQYGTSSFLPELNKFYHYSITLDLNSLKLKFYKNGLLYSSSTISVDDFRIETLLLSINKKQSTGGNNFDTNVCSIDDVRIYATALSADDIKELYQTRAQLDNKGNFFLSQINQPAIVTDGLVGWWPLAGDTKDYSGYANDGVNNGAVSTTGVTGEADTAYQFTEHTDYMQLPAEPSLVNSISFWLKEDAVTDWLPFVGQSNSHYLMATGGGTGAFYHSIAGSPLIYRDAQSTLYPAGDTAWHHYVAINLDISAWTIIKLSGYGTANWPLEGKVADVRFYSRNLSEGEIQLLYKKGLGLLT